MKTEDIVATDNEKVINEVVLEDYGSADKDVPKSKVYVIRIDKHTFRYTDQFITGEQLLELVEKQPIEQYKVFQKLCGGQRKEILPDEVVDLRSKGIERFQTVPLCETEG